jgi:hypothetical protein
MSCMLAGLHYTSQLSVWVWQLNYLANKIVSRQYAITGIPLHSSTLQQKKTNIYLQAVAIQNQEIEYSALLLTFLLPKHNFSNMKQYIPPTPRWTLPDKEKFS